jgi:glycosyltransferase involved in cell wall biosynthesis
VSSLRVLSIANQFDRCEAALLVALRDRGVRIVAMCDPDAVTTRELVRSDVPVLPLNPRARLDLTAVRAVRREMESLTPHIVHAFSNRTLTAAILAGAAKRSSLVAYRGTMGHLSRFDPASWTSYLYPRLKRIICVSHAVEDYLAGFLPRDRLRTIYKGHRAEWYTRERPRDLAEFGVPPGAFVVCCVANVRPVKGIRYLLSALQYLPEEAGVHVLLVGKVEEQAVAKMLPDDRLGRRVHLAGFQANVAGILRSAHVFVMPSIAREGLPKALLEANAVGLPGIVTRVGGMPEVVIDGETGLVVDPCNSRALAEAILRFRLEPNLSDQLGRAAAERVRTKFTLEQTIDETFKLYQETA